MLLFTITRILALFMHAFVLNVEIRGDHGILVRVAISKFYFRNILFLKKGNGKRSCMLHGQNKEQNIGQA